MRKTVLILALLALLSAAQARVYLGFPTGVIFTGLIPSPVTGFHIGTYKLYDDFGVRATAELGANFNVLIDPTAPVTPIVEGSVDGTYSFGEGVVFYTGAGVGYGSAGGGGSPFVSALYHDRKRVTLPDGVRKEIYGYGPTRQVATDDLYSQGLGGHPKPPGSGDDHRRFSRSSCSFIFGQRPHQAGPLQPQAARPQPPLGFRAGDGASGRRKLALRVLIGVCMTN